MTFGNRVRELRHAKEWSLRVLAAKVDVGFTYLSRVENERLNFGDYPSDALIHRLADAIYQWKQTSRAGYLEWLAEWLVQSFPEITLVTTGVRSRTFRVSDHRGQIKLNTAIGHLTEKRIVRAVFSAQRRRKCEQKSGV